MISELKSHKFMSKNKFIFQLMTVWDEKNLTPTKKILYFVHSIIFRSTIFFMYLLPQAINVYIVYGDLEEFSKSTYIFITFMLEIIKAYVYYSKQNEIQELFEDFDNDCFHPRNENEEKLVKKTIKFGNRVNSFLFCLYNMTAFCVCFPIFDTINKNSLPFKAWYPFRTNQSPVYEIVYGIQIFYTFVFTNLDASLDTTPVFMMMLILVRIDILLVRLRNGYNGYLEDMKHKNSDDINDMIYLKECAQQHDLVIKYAKRIEKILSTIIVNQFSVSCIIICITMFRMSVEQPLSIQFSSTFSYQSCMVSQLFLYAWFGNELTLKCSMVSQAVYFSDWYERGTKYCRTLKFIMMRAAIPVRITGGYFFSLSIEAFTAILRSSWSYFALLRQVNEEVQNN